MPHADCSSNQVRAVLFLTLIICFFSLKWGEFAEAVQCPGISQAGCRERRGGVQKGIGWNGGENPHQYCYKTHINNLNNLKISIIKTTQCCGLKKNYRMKKKEEENHEVMFGISCHSWWHDCNFPDTSHLLSPVQHTLSSCNNSYFLNYLLVIWGSPALWIQDNSSACGRRSSPWLHFESIQGWHCPQGLCCSSLPWQNAEVL